MLCFDCAKSGSTRDAVGLCQHCSAALCYDHARTVEDPIIATYPIGKTVVLPKHARLILCETCKTALGQSHEVASLVA